MSAAEVIAQHSGPFFMDGIGTVECCCDKEVGSDAEWAVHLLAALKAAGYAVVELPKPNCAKDELGEHETFAWIDLTNGWESVSVVDDEVALTANAGFYSPADASAIAAALLAAADATEAS